MSRFEQDVFLEMTEKFAGIGWWRIDLVDNTLTWSDLVYKMHGLEADIYTPELDTAISFYHPEDQSKVEQYVTEAIQENTSFEFELRIIRPDHSVRWVHSKGQCVSDADGNVTDVYGMFEDVTEERRAKARFELSIDAARAGVWDWSIPKGTFITSPLFHAMLGEEPARTPLELSYFLNLLHPEDVPRANEEIQNAHSIKNYIYDIDFRLRCKDGSYKWIRSAGQVVEYDVNNAPLRMIGLHFDINEQKNNEEQLRGALNQAKDANKAKSEFLANMSHEIRTPMNGVLGMTDLLLATALEDEQQDLAMSVKRSGETLLRVINDILDFSKIEAGKIELAPVVFSISELLGDLPKLYNVLATQKGISLHLSDSLDVPEFLYGDADRLRQILVNLIGNAIKFTPEGGHVCVSVFGHKKEADHVEVMFSISDTGIGISEEKQQKIFDAFVQADATTTRNFGGTGLGLAISSELVSIMGGTIDLKSTPGFGSTFSFTARFGISEAPVCIDEPPASISEKCRSLNILLTEDNIINQKVAGKFLEHAGHTVVVADNGEIAVDKFKEGTFDIILMDIQMPVMSGEQALVEIRALPTGHQIPIIALTANAMAGDREKYLAEGFDGYVSKPIRKEELYAELKRLSDAYRNPALVREKK
ncbi:MAG: PAS domain-containing protein [Rhodothermales bacterium]